MSKAVQTMDRFLNQSGLSYTYEVLSMGLKESLGLGRRAEQDSVLGDNKEEPESKINNNGSNEEQGEEIVNVTEREEEKGDSKSKGWDDVESVNMQGQATIHQIISSALFLALLVFKFGSPRRDTSEDRFRGRDFLRLILLDMLLVHRERVHLSNIVTSLTVLEAMLAEGTLRRAFLELGGLIIVPKLMIDIGDLPVKRSSSVVDVREMAYSLIEGDYCPNCFYGNNEPEGCCRTMTLAAALKATEVLWTSTFKCRSSDTIGMAHVIREAKLVLRQLLTPGLLAVLTVERSAYRFLSVLFTPDSIIRPFLHWSPDLRNILQDTLAEQANKILDTGSERSRWPLWNAQADFILPDTYRSLYPSLRDLAVVDDIFIDDIVAGDLDLGPGKQVADFLESLEVSIQGSLSVLQLLAGRPVRALEEADAIARQEKSLHDKQKTLEVMLMKYPEEKKRRSSLLGIGTKSTGPSRRPVFAKNGTGAASNGGATA